MEPAQLVALLSSWRAVVLLLGSSSPQSFLPAIARRYGAPTQSAGLAYYNLRGPAEQGWILPLIEAVLPEGQGLRRELRRGYYLFLRGQVLGHHPGLYHPRFDAAMARAERAMRASFSTAATVAAARRQLEQVSEEAAQLVISHFDSLLTARSPAAAAGADPYAVLGVSPGATAGEIRAAYHLRMREVHPDRVAQLGLEEQQRALRLSQEIIEAYQLLK